MDRFVFRSPAATSSWTPETRERLPIGTTTEQAPRRLRLSGSTSRSTCAGERSVEGRGRRRHRFPRQRFAAEVPELVDDCQRAPRSSSDGLDAVPGGVRTWAPGTRTRAAKGTPRGRVRQLSGASRVGQRALPGLSGPRPARHRGFSTHQVRRARRRDLVLRDRDVDRRREHRPADAALRATVVRAPRSVVARGSTARRCQWCRPLSLRGCPATNRWRGARGPLPRRGDRRHRRRATGRLPPATAQLPGGAGPITGGRRPASQISLPCVGVVQSTWNTRALLALGGNRPHRRDAERLSSRELLYTRSARSVRNPRCSLSSDGRR